MKPRAIAAWLLAASLLPAPARAWGDKGHIIVARIAEAYLTPTARKRVEALLAADPDTLTEPKIGPAATWADRYRDANIDDARQRTRLWHFVDIEISHPDLHGACFDAPAASEVPASRGPAQDCIVNKIQAFTGELANPATVQAERIVALKFLLHFVGDLHQPLHTADDHDRGGNDKRVAAEGFKAGTLHHYWDTEFVDELGADPARTAGKLRKAISDQDRTTWSRGSAADWALESFEIARGQIYGRLPSPDPKGTYRLTNQDVETSVHTAARQLSKAGVRLAMVLNQALDPRR